MVSKIFFGILFLLILANFVSAERNQQIDPSDPFIQDKMIMNLPELSGFTFGGTWEPYISIDLRYISPVDNDQHSEYYLVIYNTSEQANARLEDILQQARYSHNVSTRIINGNQVFEVTSESEPNFREFDWVSENYLLRGWGGNDMGSVYDEDLFYVLTNAYLEKYPILSEEQDCTDECSPVGQKRCEGDNSQTCGNYDSDECLEWNFGMICPYGCSGGICNYILEEQENGTIFYIAPNITSGPIEMPKEEELTTRPAPIICQGCELDSKCYPYGYRKEGKFCSDSNNLFIEQKQADSSCENNFECSTNICIDNQCISSGLWQKFLNWFKRLFGAE